MSRHVTSPAPVSSMNVMTSLYAPVEPRPAALHLDIVADREDLASARLVFTRGCAHVTLRAGELDEQLLVASFFKCIPEVTTERGGTVAVRYPRTSVLDYRAFSAEIALAAGVEWALEGEEGQTDVVLDLRAARLGSVALRGGQFDVTLKLPPVQGVVPLVLDGGAINVNVVHAPEVPVAVTIAGGVDDCTFDGRHVAALDTDLQLHAGRPASGYALQVTGGATRLRVTSWEPQARRS